MSEPFEEPTIKDEVPRKTEIAEEVPFESSSTTEDRDPEETSQREDEEPSGEEVVPAPAPTKGKHADEDKVEPMVRIWYATNRKTDEKGEFTEKRDPKVISYGRIDVELAVAQHHSPPKKSTEGLKPVKRNENEFFAEIDDCLDTYRELGCTSQILVSFHNYNVGFKSALMAAAHWQEDLNVAGPSIAFSWPSIGKSGNYEADVATLERSEPEIVDFLEKITELCGSENIHLVADGTACQGLIRVLQRIFADGKDYKFGQIFLLAPDVDRDLFVDLAWLFPKYSTRTTLYASHVDKDTVKSVKRHKSPRAGVFDPYTIVEGVDTIAIPSLETDDLMSEHKTRSYEIVTLFYDMYDLMKSNAPPRRRLHLSKQVDNGKTYWKLRKL